MALTDFFRINMPYGLKKNPDGSWFVFNREYLPLGFWDTRYKTESHLDKPYRELPVNCFYRRCTWRLLESIIELGEAYVKRNDKGEVYMIFLYNDLTNPQSRPEYWPQYWKKIELLSSLKKSRKLR